VRNLKKKQILSYRRRKIFLILALAAFAYVSTPVICLAEACEVRSLGDLPGCLYQDAKHVLTSPLRWKQDESALFAALSLGTVGLMMTDENLQELVQNDRSSGTDRVFEWTSKYTRRIVNITAGGLFLCGVLFRDPKSRQTALLCLESVALAQGITTGLKHVVGRSRPHANKGACNFDPMEFPPPSYSLSFPSGHAATAFAFSSVIARRHESWLVKLISYGFAVMVSMSRVNNNAHFPSDVFWGAVVGIAVGRCLVEFHKGEKQVDYQLGLDGRFGSTGVKVSIWVN
jgi:membrane-associated PAP2 superfamily phosphatase